MQNATGMPFSRLIQNALYETKDLRAALLFRIDSLAEIFSVAI